MKTPANPLATRAARFALLIGLLLLAVAGRAQSANRFDGYWLGEVTTQDDRTMSVVLKISNGIAHQCTYSKEGGLQLKEDLVSENTDNTRNNLCYTWMNSGGIWTETQTFMLSHLNTGKVQAIWVRQVNNYKEGDNDNEEWYVFGRGVLKRLSDDDLASLRN